MPKPANDIKERIEFTEKNEEKLENSPIILDIDIQPIDDSDNLPKISQTKQNLEYQQAKQKKLAKALRLNIQRRKNAEHNK